MRLTATVACPVCGQVVLAPTHGVCWSHCDGVGRTCQFSGQPFGAVVQGRTELEKAS